MNEMTDIHIGRRFATVRQIPGIPEYKWLTESAIRHHIFGAESRTNSAGETIPGNGFGRAILRIGRKILIDLDEFDRWLDEHRQDSEIGAVAGLALQISDQHEPASK